jgi:hypothetical protein
MKISEELRKYLADPTIEWQNVIYF